MENENRTVDHMQRLVKFIPRLSRYLACLYLAKQGSVLACVWFGLNLSQNPIACPPLTYSSIQDTTVKLNPEYSLCIKWVLIYFPIGQFGPISNNNQYCLDYHEFICIIVLLKANVPSHRDIGF